MRPSTNSRWWGCVEAFALAAVAAVLATPLPAQELEPRSYSNAPIGLNFLIAGYDYSTGGIATDPALPVDDAELEFHGPIFGYAYSLGIAGKSAKIAVVVPTGFLSGTATFAGRPQTRDVSGLLDPKIRLSVNLFGAPALTPRGFAGYHQDWIGGVSLHVTAPLGQYDPTRVANLGTNRWSIKPEFGVSKALGSWTFELSASATFYTDNNDYLGGLTREQDPLYGAQAHAVYTFRSRIWLAVDGTFYEGAAVAVDGAPAAEALSGSRLGLTLSLPLNPRNSLKIAWSSGLSVRTSADYDAVSASWQYIWGGGVP